LIADDADPNPTDDLAIQWFFLRRRRPWRGRSVLNDFPVRSATAQAGANIALVKYWGKRDAALNLPAAGSISITLEQLTTCTTLIPDRALSRDQLLLNGQPQDPTRVAAVLDLMRAECGQTVRFCVDSHNSFPTAAGLASSASAFAALVVAADRALNLNLSRERWSELARRGSGSAARSVFGGFVEMAVGTRADGRDSVARPLADPAHWPLEVVAAITDAGSKPVSSTEGMRRTVQTSPYYPAWVAGVAADLDTARAAIMRRDFECLADVAEHSALKMHASALAARPAVVYWNAATVECMQVVRELRRQGHEVFFTIDAGPQVKAICRPQAAASVAAALSRTPGVLGVLRSALGPGAGSQS